MLAKRATVSYTVGRVAVVATKPLCLFVANNYLAPTTTEGLAVAFLASSLALVGVAADPHRRFYLSLFTERRGGNGFSFYLYLASLILLGGFGCIAVFTVVFLFGKSTTLAVAGVTFFASEKVADELLRLRLFERNLGGWGRLSMARGALQIAGLVLLLGTLGTGTSAALAVLVLALGNFLVFLPQVPTKIGRTVAGHTFKTLGWLAVRGWRSLASNWVLWAVALLGSGVGYLDRIVALALDKASLPLFMLVVMCFSVVQMAIDFFYVSRHRRDFLERRIAVWSAFRSREFLVSLCGGFAVAVLACFLVLRFSRNGSLFPFGYVMAISILQVLLAAVLVPHQIIYWWHHIHGILRIEMFFWASFFLVGLVSWWAGLPPMGILAVVVVCALVRLLLFLAAASRVGLAPQGS